MTKLEELKAKEYIKQLKKENELLKNRVMRNMLDENIQIARLRLEIQNLNRDVEKLKKRNTHLVLFGN